MVETNINRYGNACSLGSKKIYEKARKTCIEKYGDIYPLRSDEYRDELLEKRKKTNLKKYNSEEIPQSDYFKNKVKINCMKKYGTESPNQSIYS